jgi:integrase
MAVKGRKRKDGYTLYQRKDNGSYAMRFSLSGHPQFRFGLGTFDEAEAKALADEKYLETKILAKNNLLTGVASFDALAADYLAILEAKAAKDPSLTKGYRYAKGVVNRYLIPKFGSDPITIIQHKQLMEYVDWRKTYWTEGPGMNEEWIKYKRGGVELARKAPNTEVSVSTLKRESNIIRGVFKQAVREGILKPSDIPRLELGKSQSKKRPAFTKDEYRHLLAVSAQRIGEVRNKKQRFERFLLHNFMIVAAETGMRTMELFNLNWRHIEGFEEAVKGELSERSVTIYAHGKGRLPQRFVPRREVISGLQDIHMAYERTFGHPPEPDDPVFVNYKGTRIKSFNGSLRPLLKAANLEADASGNPFTAYCFRHSYATWALQRDPPVDIYWLATNMRTSVEMIERWYSKVIPADQARVLRGDADWE